MWFIDVQALLKRRVGLEECIEPCFVLCHHDRPFPLFVRVLPVSCPIKRDRK
jgi:hypothetical protein